MTWPEHWTRDDKLRDLHARHHSEPGNMLGPNDCEWQRCEFWSTAGEVYDALAADAAAIEEAEQRATEPCTAEIHSWDYFRPTQLDSYWIRCTRLGEHEEHEDSNTGAHWPATR